MEATQNKPRLQMRYAKAIVENRIATGMYTDADYRAARTDDQRAAAEDSIAASVWAKINTTYEIV